MVACIEQIVNTDRWNSFDRWHETSATLVRAFEEAGAFAEVYSVPTGGTAGDGRWVIHEAEDVHDATLDVVTPMQQRIADFRVNPWQVIQWTMPTPAEGMECDLAVVDTEAQFSRLGPRALAGKMVLTRLNAWDLRQRFCEKGAYGIISDPPIPDCPGAVGWVKFGWGGLQIHGATARLVGIALSAQRGDALRLLLAQHGKVRVKVRIDARRYAGTHDVVSGLVLGRDDPQSEVWAVAHGAEPGALDNASGVASCIEIARIINELVRAGQLRPPRRTIRLLAGYECYGFFHYLEHHKRFQPPLAGVCIDTIGARAELCKRTLKWHETVSSSASFVDDLGEEIIRAALAIDSAGYQLERKPFVSTEDTLLGDPKYGFPCPWITNHPFAGYHSSADTIERVDPRGLVTCTAAMAAYLYYLADAGTPEMVELAGWMTQKTKERLAASGLTKARAHYFHEQHAVNMERLKRWAWGGTANLNPQSAICNPQSGPSATPDPLSKIPLRRIPLAPTPENTWPPITKAAGALPKWAIYWADGNRSIAEISELLSAEPGFTLKPEKVPEYFQAMADLGYIELIDPGDMIGEEKLVADLRALGLAAGMDVMVHSSLSQIGPVRGGAEAVVRALLAAISPGGTLLAPSFNHFIARIFNPLTTPTTNGAIPDALWRRPDARRSLHPTHSVAAIGPRAEEYVADHLANGIWAQSSPIGRLIHGGGYILSLGVTNESSTAYHIAEISLNVPCLDQFASVDRIVTPDGSVSGVPSLAWRDGSCPVDVKKKLDETLNERGLQRHGRVGKADSTLVKAIDVWTVRREHLRGVCSTCHVRPYVRK